MGQNEVTSAGDRLLRIVGSIFRQLTRGAVESEAVFDNDKSSVGHFK